MCACYMSCISGRPSYLCSLMYWWYINDAEFPMRNPLFLKKISQNMTQQPAEAQHTIFFYGNGATSKNMAAPRRALALAIEPAPLPYQRGQIFNNILHFKLFIEIYTGHQRIWVYEAVPSNSPWCPQLKNVGKLTLFISPASPPNRSASSRSPPRLPQTHGHSSLPHPIPATLAVPRGCTSSGGYGWHWSAGGSWEQSSRLSLGERSSGPAHGAELEGDAWGQSSGPAVRERSSRMVLRGGQRVGQS
jgi:hypothetical protein